MITEKDARAGAARDMGFLAERDFQIRDNHRLTSEVWRLEDENAKLRELVRDMYEMAYPEYPSAFDAAFSDRMRELGIEVDE